MEHFIKELQRLEHKGLLREMKIVDSPQEARIKIGRKNLINLCSNNYLGLCNDKRLKIAAIRAIKKYGVGSGASRLISGNMRLHCQLEERICRFKKTDAALVFNSGYCANLGIIPALAGREDVVFSDRLNHASIVDANILCRAEVRRYPHNDMIALERLLAASTSFRRRVIVTDSVFSMDGDIASLPSLEQLAAKYGAFLMIDDAHATGILGGQGRGSLEHFGIENDSIIQMGTLSKALGCFGAFVCGSKSFINYLINKARPFVYTTALPVSVCASAIAAIDIIEKKPDIINRLKRNIVFLKDNLRVMGFSISSHVTPIIPLIIGNNLIAIEFSRRLFKSGIFAQAVRPPTVPEGTSRLRITVTASHRKQDLEISLEIIEKTAKQLGVIK